jgi:3',5'-cyclic AMP phosphodiesterase CpdA
MIIAQISDLHVTVAGGLVYDRIDTGDGLARCVGHLLRLKPRPELVLATGDLVNDGTAAEYRRVRELLAPLTMPVFLIPGNHDDRGALRAEFRDHGYLPADGRPLYYAVEGHPVRLLALDTTVPGAVGGALDSDQLAWLEAELGSAPRRPTLVFMHHPPFRTGIPRMDRIGLEAGSAERLGAIVSRHRHIERITCGHVHRDIRARWSGLVASVCPSTAFQYILDLADEGLKPTDEPPAYQLHFWNGGGLVTHTVAVSGDG